MRKQVVILAAAAINLTTAVELSGVGNARARGARIAVVHDLTASARPARPSRGLRAVLVHADV